MALDSKFQMVRFRTNGQIIKITLILLILLTNETLMLSLLGLGWRFCFRNISRIRYNVKSFVSKIHRVARTCAAQGGINAAKLPRRRRFRFQIVLWDREEIIVHVNQTYIVLLKFLLTSLISAFPREFLWREYGGLLDNRSLEVRLFLELLCKGKQDNNCF
jgi:hypothetical protein